VKNLVLADGQVTAADTLVIVLAEPDGEPDSILIRWPGNGEPTVTTPKQLGAVAQATMRCFARAVAQLALIRAAEDDPRSQR
jgi:hypothetical protein